jgi:hypothetical protein
LLVLRTGRFIGHAKNGIFGFPVPNNHEEPGSTESITTGIEGGYQRSGVDHASFYEAEGR